MRPLPSIAAKLVPEYRPGVTIAIAVAPVLAPPGNTFLTPESQASEAKDSGGDCPSPIPAYQLWIGVERGKLDRKSTRLKSSHSCASHMPSSACKKKKNK